MVKDIKNFFIVIIKDIKKNYNVCGFVLEYIYDNNPNDYIDINSEDELLEDVYLNEWWLWKSIK